MKLSLKKAVALTLAGVSALGAMTASADVILPGTGNGELVLFVRNDTTGAVYARGLQVQLDSVMTQASVVATPYTGIGTAATYVLPTIAPDAALSSFLNGSDAFTWTVMAGDNTGGIATGDKRYLTTTPNDLASVPTNGQLAVNFNNLNQMLITLNGILADGAGSSTSVDGQWRQTGAVPGSGAGDWYSASVNNVNSVGTAANFYLLTTASGSPRAYQFADLVLSANGELSSVAGPGPIVPIPAAVWLLGSGLISLAGVARRKALV